MRFLTLISVLLIACSPETCLKFPSQAMAVDPVALAKNADLSKRIDEMIGKDEERLLGIFKQLHANPELGFHETKTAALVAKEFQALGYETLTGIGKTGVVGILKNGPGPVLMYRGDMDGLPVKELTDLPYASKATAAGEGGGFVPVMHACGHDAHVTFLLGLAKVMVELKAEWSGTLVLVAQPAEEVGLGASAMVKDRLYDKVPKPDYLIAPHVIPIHPAGRRPSKLAFVWPASIRWMS
jgi:amidohydrolase